MIVEFNLQSQIEQTGSHRELSDPPEEEDFKSKLHLRMRSNAMAMLTVVEQYFLQLKEVVKLIDLRPGSNHLTSSSSSADCYALARVGYKKNSGCVRGFAEERLRRVRDV